MTVLYQGLTWKNLSTIYGTSLLTTSLEELQGKLLELTELGTIGNLEFSLGLRSYSHLKFIIYHGSHVYSVRVTCR